MSAARFRLLLGIGGVGLLVVTAAGLLLTGLPVHWFPRSQTPGSEFVWLLAMISIWALLVLPFDLLSVMRKPSSPQGERRQPGRIGRLLTAVVMQAVLLTVLLWVHLQVGKLAGPLGVLLCFILTQLLLVIAQGRLWQFMAGVRGSANRAESVSLVPSRDHRFTGGIVGLPGRERILAPASWKSRLGDSLLELWLQRRKLAIASGARRRGLWAAVVWNTLLLSVALAAAGGQLTSVRELTATWLWFLLLSFSGLLILPAVTRRAVLALDRRLVAECGPRRFAELVNRIDTLTEDEPERSAAAESVFQPIPCPARRQSVSPHAEETRFPAWNLARMVLYLSWAFGGPLARSVHCNVGHPELWVLPPAD